MVPEWGREEGQWRQRGEGFVGEIKGNKHFFPLRSGTSG
jgi:hypothetical protein